MDYYNGTIYTLTFPQGLHGQFRGVQGNIESLLTFVNSSGPTVVFWDDSGIPHLVVEGWHFKADGNA